MKKISFEKKEQVKSMILHGLYGYQIAERAQVSEGTVQKIRNELKKEGNLVGYDR